MTLHQSLARLSGIEEVERALNSIWDGIRVVTRASLVDSDGRNNVDPEHEGILDAITSENEELASQLATAHVLSSTLRREEPNRMAGCNATSPPTPAVRADR